MSMRITSQSNPAWRRRNRLLRNGGRLRWWDPDAEGLSCYGAWQAKGSGSLTASLQDLTGQENDLIVGVPPAWDVANGWVFTGTEFLLTTFDTIEADQSQTMIAQFTGVVPGASVLAGASDGLDAFSMSAADIGFAGVRVYVNTLTGAAGLAAAGSVVGNLCVAGNAGYIDGVSEIPVGGAGPPIAFVVYVGAMNLAGVPASFLVGNIQAFALYSTALTAPQVLAVATSMASL